VAFEASSLPTSPQHCLIAPQHCLIAHGAHTQNSNTTAAHNSTTAAAHAHDTATDRSNS
jgi:hypothetical protein